RGGGRRRGYQPRHRPGDRLQRDRRRRAGRDHRLRGLRPDRRDRVGHLHPEDLLPEHRGAAAVGTPAQGSAGQAVGGLQLAGAVAGSINRITGGVEALVRDGSSVTTGGGEVKLTATDTSTITADAGGFALGLQLLSQQKASLSVGASFAVNEIGR